MANLDTRSKRMSGINPASPWRSFGKGPSASFNGNERQAADFMYSGISADAAASPSASVGGGYSIQMFRRRIKR